MLAKKIKKIIASALIIVSIFIVVPFKTVNASVMNMQNTTISQMVKQEKNIVYLSPSTQYDNPYTTVNGVNTTEGKTMQEIGNLVKENLQRRGVEVHMNNPNQGVNGHVARGNSIKGVNCYVALHSNACPKETRGRAQGILVITRNDAESKKLSNLVYNKLQSIYPYKEKSRGIIFNNKFKEINSPNAPTLIAEIGFHDNKKDAEFLLNNKQQIADAVADAIYAYLKN